MFEPINHGAPSEDKLEIVLMVESSLQKVRKTKPVMLCEACLNSRRPADLRTWTTVVPALSSRALWLHEV